jgi:hypothetical protein
LRILLGWLLAKSLDHRQRPFELHPRRDVSCASAANAIFEVIHKGVAVTPRATRRRTHIEAQ